MPATHTSAGAVDLVMPRREGPAFAFHARPVAGAVKLGDQLRGGLYKVTGTVKKKGVPSNVPTYARVRLYRDRDGLYIAQTWSDPTTGAYEFRDLDGRFTYSAVAYDPAMSYRAVVGDRLAPTAM